MYLTLESHFHYALYYTVYGLKMHDTNANVSVYERFSWRYLSFSLTQFGVFGVPGSMIAMI